jgi:hypothetical protein
VPNNPRDLIYKPNETEWPQMAALRNVTKITLRNTVTHLYALDSTRKVRTQPLTTRWLNISWHFIQEQTMMMTISKALEKSVWIESSWHPSSIDFKTKEEYSSKFETVDLSLTKPYCNPPVDLSSVNQLFKKSTILQYDDSSLHCASHF